MVSLATSRRANRSTCWMIRQTLRAPSRCAGTTTMISSSTAGARPEPVSSKDALRRRRRLLRTAAVLTVMGWSVDLVRSTVTVSRVTSWSPSTACLPRWSAMTSPFPVLSSRSRWWWRSSTRTSLSKGRSPGRRPEVATPSPNHYRQHCNGFTSGGGLKRFRPPRSRGECLILCNPSHLEIGGFHFMKLMIMWLTFLAVCGINIA